MTSYRLASTSDSNGACGTIGGKPSLPVGSEWPVCRLCNEPLVSFFDLVLPKAKDSPFVAGSRLQIFACGQHDDITGTIYSDYSQFDQAAKSHKLPRAYWELSDGHYLLRMLPPTQAVQEADAQNRLQQQYLQLESWRDQPSEDLKLFGEPDWIQDDEEHTCACGQPMKLLLQVPDGMGFPMAKDAQQQPSSYSASKYCLFLGNQLYLLGCTAHCNPLALWPVLQN